MKNKMIPPPRQVPKKKPPPPQIIFTVEQETQGTASIEQPETERPEKVVGPKEEIKVEVPADKIEAVQIEEKSQEAPVQSPTPQQVVESVIIVPGIVKKPPVSMKAPTKKPGRTPPPIGRPPTIPSKVEQPTPSPAAEKAEQAIEQKIQITKQPAPVEAKLEQKEAVVIQQPIVKQEVKEQASLPELTPRVEPEMVVRIVPKAPVAPKKAAKMPGPPPKAVIPFVAKVAEPENKPQEMLVDSPPQQQPSKIQPPVETKRSEKTVPLPVEQKRQEHIDPEPLSQTHEDFIPTPSPNPNPNPNIKSEIFPSSQPGPKPNASMIQAQSAKSKMAEKLEELRKAKEKMLNDDPSFDDEDENNRYCESGLNKSDYILEQKIEERKEVVVEEIKPAKSQVIAKEEVVPPIYDPRMAPPPVKAPVSKAPGRQPPSFPQKPIPTQKPKPVIAEVEPEAKIKEKEIKEVKEPKEKPKAEPVPASIFPAQPIAPSQQPKPGFTLKVSIQQPKNTIQIKSLLQKYHGLKNSYLNNLRQLDELIHFQKQQQDSEIDKINKLLNDLHKKNQAIKQICSVKELPVNDSPVAV